jgi:hypothetical protein
MPLLSLADSATLKHTIDRISKVTPEARAQWGRMNAHQMLCHLSDSFSLPLGTKSASPATGVFQRTAMKWGALYVPLPWPKLLPTRPEMDQFDGGTPPAHFDSDRARLVAAIQFFAAPSSDAANFHPHPMFLKMSRWEWMRWGYLHADHHLRQFGA